MNVVGDAVNEPSIAIDPRSANIAVSPAFDPHVGWPIANDKLGDYYRTISDDTGVNIAYAATFNGQQDVYFLRAEPGALFTTLPESFNVLFGGYQSGAVEDLNASDDAYLVIEPRPASVSAVRVPARKPLRKSPARTPGATSPSSPPSSRTSMKVQNTASVPSRSCCT